MTSEESAAWARMKAYAELANKNTDGTPLIAVPASDLGKGVDEAERLIGERKLIRIRSEVAKWASNGDSTGAISNVRKILEG